MNNKIKEAFDYVHAEEELKNNTKDFIAKKTRGYKKGMQWKPRSFVPALACLLFMVLGGHWLYFEPTAEISIDINPSIELGVNRFDKVVSAESYNDDGKELLSSLDVKYMDYNDAVDEILENERISALLDDGEVMTIGVIGSDGKQSSRMLSGIENCTAKEKNTYCYYAHSDEVAKAHEQGLSYGKYRALLEIQSFDPDFSAEEIKGMTMRQIRELIDDLSASADNEIQENDCTGNGQGKQYGQERGQGKNGKHKELY